MVLAIRSKRVMIAQREYDECGSFFCVDGIRTRNSILSGLNLFALGRARVRSWVSKSYPTLRSTTGQCCAGVKRHRERGRGLCVSPDVGTAGLNWALTRGGADLLTSLSRASGEYDELN